MAKRLIIALAAALLAAAGCGPQEGGASDGELAGFLDGAPAFVESRRLRRRALEASLVNPDNGYSQLRLANYARADGGWDALPVWNPPVRPVTAADLGRFEDDPYAVSDGAFAPVFGDEVPWARESMLALGRRAFERYPLELDPALTAGLSSADRADDMGLWTDRREHVGGLVRVRLPDGRETTSVTCATCHSSPGADGHLVVGRTNTRLKRDAMTSLYFGGPARSDWGAGRVDVTPDGRDNPTAITDLRAVSHQSYLHWAATLRNSPEALAIRTETLIITSLGQRVRPPRQVAMALAYYVWSLGDGGQGGTPLDEHQRRGRSIFEEACARCHHADGTTAGTASLAEIGTDPAVASSPMRTTGRWRIPSLWRVSERGQLLHDGSVDTVEQLLDPARLSQIPGHTFGTALDPTQRQDLAAYLRTL